MFSNTAEETTTNDALQTNNELSTHIITSLNILNSIPPQRLIEALSIIHKQLEKDAIYSKMDTQSQSLYRAKVSHISLKTHLNERIICEAALSLAQSANASDIRSHVGYYLIDEGFNLLLKNVNAYGSFQKTPLLLIR